MSFLGGPLFDEIDKIEIPNLERYLENPKIPMKRVHVEFVHNNQKVIEIDKLVPIKNNPLKTPIQIIYEHLKDILPEIYSSYMMNCLPLKIWKDFIKDFQEEIDEYYEEIREKPYWIKNELLNKKLIDIVHIFYIEYSFYDIEKLVKWKEYGTYEILRRIRNYCLSWESYSNKELPYYIYHFGIEHWEFFFQNHFRFTKKMFDMDKMFEKVNIWKPITFPVSLYSDVKDYYSFFSWKKFEIKTLDEKDFELTKSFLSKYFHPDSHFENNIFWLENRVPYYIYYNNEKINEIDYNNHKENYRNEKIGILECPYHLIHTSHKEKIKDFCSKKLLPQKIWNFLDSSSKQPLKEILKKCFHILGRIYKGYGLYQYHDTLFYYLENNYLVLNKLYNSPNSILFPEYSFQKDSIKKIFIKKWEETFLFFQDEILSFIFKEEWDKSIYIEPIPFFQNNNSLKEKENIFSILNKRKTYYQYFSMKDILSIEKEEKKDNYIDNSSIIFEIDNYIKNCLFNKNGK